MAEMTFSIGTKPIEVFVKELTKAATPVEADVLYALNRQKSRIIDRTARGVDINEQAFHPYSEKGPFYWYPGKAAGGSGSKGRGAAAGRQAKKTGGTRTLLGVKFASYGAFKRSIGRSVVDLMGPTAPHMMQSIVVKVNANAGSQRIDGVIGIYGPEADRAEGHNVGAGHLPKREFFGVSPKDEDAIAKDMESLMSARISKLL